jgi:hypothetical protein
MSPTLRFRDWAVVGASILLLLLLAKLVGGPEPPELDEDILNWLGQHLPGTMREILLQVYRMSGVAFTGCLVLAALVYLMLKRWWHDLGLLVLATGGILAIVDMGLKPLFDRARPHAKLCKSVAAAAIKLPTANKAKPSNMTRLRPQRSAARPKGICSSACTRP